MYKIKYAGQPPIEWSDWGVGFRTKSRIILHKSLKDKPKLFEEVMEHEADHGKMEMFTAKDMKHDLSTTLSLGLRLHILLHPTMWVQALPIVRINGRWIWMPYNFWVWSIGLLMATLMWAFPLERCIGC